MKLQRFIGVILSLSSVLSLVAAAYGEEVVTEPEVVATAAFPESNAFGLVVNGERNSMIVTIENKSDRNVTLGSIAGSLRHPDTDHLVKNLTELKIVAPLGPNVPIRVPYAFHSEFKPGDLRLDIWLDYAVDSTVFRVTAYGSVVKIVEPEMSIFDFKMILTYLIVFAFLGATSYYAYLSLLPPPKKSRSKPAPPPGTPGTATASGVKGYEEEWIPKHHLKKSKSEKKQNATSGTSADELSAETSGAEGKRKKGGK
jgi:hypothetical protein